MVHGLASGKVSWWQTFEAFTHQTLFQPLSMTRSGDVENSAKPYDQEGKSPRS
jgi:hypothetical protein